MELTSDEPSEDGLLGRYFEGDPIAFDRLTEQWRGRLTRYFLASGFPYAEADDLAQEVIVRLFLLRDNTGFDRERPLDGYLFRTARNLGLNARRDQREVTISIDEWQHVIAPGTGESAGSDLVADVSACLAKLSPEAREVLLECGKHGLGEASHEDLARARKKWASQVSALCSQARALLRRCLERKGYR